METLRCPTCLSLLLEGGEKRCPVCRSKLRGRTQPIVLRQNTRIAALPPLPRERELRARVDAENESGYRRSRVIGRADPHVDAPPPPLIDLTTAPSERFVRPVARWVDRVDAARAAILLEAEADRAAAEMVFEPSPNSSRLLPRRRVRRADPLLDVAREVVVPDVVLERDSVVTELHADATLEALHHHPGVEVVDARAPTPPPSYVLPARTRALRITRVKTNGRRRWAVDILVRPPDAENEGA